MSAALSDIIIIGGGVIALSIARCLHKRGARRVTIVERGVCGEEASWAAAGMLGPQADVADRFFDLCSASRDLYPGFAAELLEETGVDVELDQAGTLYFAFSAEDARHLRERYEWQRAAGLPVELLSADEARRAEPFASPDVVEALFFPRDWQVENRRLVAALFRFARLSGITVRENTTVESVKIENGTVSGVETNTGSIKAGCVVLATGAWTSFIKLGDVTMPVGVNPVKGQIISFKTARRVFEHVIYSRRGYIVPRVDGRVLVGSTTEQAGYDKTPTDVAASALVAAAAEISPSLSTLEIADRWAGLRPFAADGLPVLGEVAGIKQLLIATAHYRNGILLAPMTAELIADKIMKNMEAPIFTAFGPDRFRFAAAQ